MHFPNLGKPRFSRVFLFKYVVLIGLPASVCERFNTFNSTALRNKSLCKERPESEVLFSPNRWLTHVPKEQKMAWMSSFGSSG